MKIFCSCCGRDLRSLRRKIRALREQLARPMDLPYGPQPEGIDTNYLDYWKRGKTFYATVPARLEGAGSYYYFDWYPQIKQWRGLGTYFYFDRQGRMQRNPTRFER